MSISDKHIRSAYVPLTAGCIGQLDTRARRCCTSTADFATPADVLAFHTMRSCDANDLFNRYGLGHTALTGRYRSNDSDQKFATVNVVAGKGTDWTSSASRLDCRPWAVGTGLTLPTTLWRWNRGLFIHWFRVRIPGGAPRNTC